MRRPLSSLVFCFFTLNSASAWADSMPYEVQMAALDSQGQAMEFPQKLGNFHCKAYVLIRASGQDQGNQMRSFAYSQSEGRDRARIAIPSDGESKVFAQLSYHCGRSGNVLSKVLDNEGKEIEVLKPLTQIKKWVWQCSAEQVSKQPQSQSFQCQGPTVTQDLIGDTASIDFTSPQFSGAMGWRETAKSPQWDGSAVRLKAVIRSLALQSFNLAEVEADSHLFDN